MSVFTASLNAASSIHSILRLLQIRTWVRSKAYLPSREYDTSTHTWCLGSLINREAKYDMNEFFVKEGPVTIPTVSSTPGSERDIDTLIDANSSRTGNNRRRKVGLRSTGASSYSTGGVSTCDRD